MGGFRLPSALAVQLALSRVRQGRRVGYLTDALTLDRMPTRGARAAEWRRWCRCPMGRAALHRHRRAGRPRHSPKCPLIQRIGAEEAHSAITIEDYATFKVIRRTRFDINTESEMLRF